MAWGARNGVWYVLMSCGNGMVYAMAWRASHGIWYGLAKHRMVYGMAWRGMSWYVERHIVLHA